MGQTVDDARKLAIAAIDECCDYAAKYGVFLALENHGGICHFASDPRTIFRADIVSR
jgi:sugar phosphate isomerase/epimerase